MAITTKRVVREVMVCDSCQTDIENTELGTHLEATAEGFFKKEKFEFDLCVDCGEKLGLRRRGRRPQGQDETANETTQIPKARKTRRGVAKKRPAAKAATATGADKIAEMERKDDEDWENLA